MTTPIQANLYSLGFGTRTSSPPIFAKVPPTTINVNYNLGQFWVDTVGGNVYCLTGFSSSNNLLSATWALLGSEAGALNTLTTQDATIVMPAAGNINISGATNQLTTTGAGSTVTLSLISAVITPGSLEVTGLLTGDAGATLKTAGTAINIATDSDTAAVNIATVGARTTTIGDTTAGSAMALKVGSGNFTLNGSSGSTYAIGASTTTGTITIGGTAQTGTITLGSSSGTNEVDVGAGAGATTVTLANGAGANIVTIAGGNGGVTIAAGGGTGGNTVSLNNGANASTNVTNINSGAAAATSTVNILNGNATAGTLACNIFGSTAATTAGTINIGTGAVAHVTNIGSSSGGNVTIIGGSASTLGIGLGGNAAQIITIGAAAQTGKISIADSTGAMPAVDLMNGVAAGAQVLNIASGTSATAAQTVNLLNGTTPGASTTLNVMNGAATAGTQTVNILATGATRAGAVNIGTGAAAHVLSFGSSSAGNITFTQASTSTFSIVGTGGTINIGNDATANTINIGSTSGTATNIIGGTAIAVSGANATTITIGAAAQTGKISIADSTGAMPAVDLMNGVAGGAQVLNIGSGTSSTGAQTVNLLNGTTPGASTTLNIMNGAASAGTQAVAILSSGATRAGTYNIGDGGAAHVGVIGSTTASAALTLQAGTGATGLKLSAAGNVQMVPATNSAAAASLTVNGRVFQGTFTGLTTASGASQVFTITNSAISGTTQAILVSADNLGSNDAQMTITRVLQSASTLAVTLKNNGAAALNGDVHITGWILN